MNKTNLFREKNNNNKHKMIANIKRLDSFAKSNRNQVQQVLFWSFTLIDTFERIQHTIVYIRKNILHAYIESALRLR